MSKCYFCKKEYETYPVILSTNLECFLIEMKVKDTFYNEKKDIGLCEKCRKEKVYNNNIWIIRALLPIRCKLILTISNLKDNKQDTKRHEEALERVKKWEERLEKTPEVDALYRKNAPHLYKEKPKEKTLCGYCGENNGQLWIIDPNKNDDYTEDDCWWVCKTCEKIIELQQQHALGIHLERVMRDKGKINVANNVKKRNEKVQKEIEDVAYEDGNEACCFTIEKEKDGSFKSKRKY